MIVNANNGLRMSLCPKWAGIFKAKLFPICMFLLLTLHGCSITPKPNLAKFNPSQEALYPPIMVVMTSGDFQSFRHRDAFLSALEEAHVFESVEIDNSNTDLVMVVNLDIENISMRDGAEGYTKAIVLGLSMGLVPISMEFVTKGVIKLKYQGVVFEELDIESHYKRIGNLYSFNENKDESVEGAYRKVVEEIIEEIMERDSFDKLFNKQQEQGESGSTEISEQTFKL